MAQRKEFCNSRTFSSPSPVVNPEVSAQWTRDARGEVLISLKVPRDIVDAELFVKTTRGHFGILMDPWSSTSWRKYWSQIHTPNRITKEKIRHFRQDKIGRRISLHRTAGQTNLTRGLIRKIAQPQYNPRAEELLDQSGPQRKRIGKVQKKLNKVRFESRPRKRQRPMPEEDEDPIIVAYSDEDEEVDPIIIVAGLEGDEQKDQEEEHTREEEPPQSPPEEERGNSPYLYTPKSPTYLSPGDDGWETESLPDLVTPNEEEDSTINQMQKSPEAPADLDANKDFFRDTDRQLVVQQQFRNEIAQAPWNPPADSDNPLSKLEDMVSKATPIYDGFWKDNDMAILSRLDAAAKKLKAKRSNTREEAHDVPPTEEQERSDTEDPHPSDLESALMNSNRHDLQDNLEDVISRVPVEPMTPQTGPPKVVHPMPYSKHDIMVPPPQGIPTNFSIKLKSVMKMKTGPPSQKSKMLVDLVTRPKLRIKKLTSDEIKEMTSSE